MKLKKALNIAAVACALLSTRAAYSSCEYPIAVIPSDPFPPLTGAVPASVPTNTKVWVLLEIPETRAINIELEDEFGRSIDGTNAPLNTAKGRVVVFTPRQELEMGATYSVILRDGGTPLPTQLRFTVNTEKDISAPEKPSLRQRNSFSYPGGCDDNSRGDDEKGVVFEHGPGPSFMMVSDLQTPPEARLGAETMAFVRSSKEWTPNTAVVRYGKRGHWAAKDGDSGEFRFAAVDLAGNVSEWSEPVAAHIDESGVLGCSTTGEAGKDGLVMFSLLALAGLGLSRKTK